MESQARVVPITREYDATEIKGIISQCDLFVGARMHSCIAAISMGVPTVAIASSYKTFGLMRSVDLEKYVCNFSTMTLEELTQKVNDIWQGREKIKSELKPRAESLKEAVWFNGKVVKDFLDAKRGA